MTRDLRDLLGYTLIATTRQVRLIRRLDALDPTQTAIFAARSGRRFDRRRLAYLCLVLASFVRSRVEVSLADLVRTFTPAANAIDGLGFDRTAARCGSPTVRLSRGPATQNGATRSTTSTMTFARRCSARRVLCST
jgi:uncharacterized protein DUF2398